MKTELRLKWRKAQFKTTTQESVRGFEASIGKLGVARVYSTEPSEWRAAAHVGPWQSVAARPMKTIEDAKAYAESLVETAAKRVKREADGAVRLFANRCSKCGTEKKP